jgi:hypothetical protein
MAPRRAPRACWVLWLSGLKSSSGLQGDGREGAQGAASNANANANETAQPRTANADGTDRSCQPQSLGDTNTNYVAMRPRGTTECLRHSTYILPRELSGRRLSGTIEPYTGPDSPAAGSGGPWIYRLGTRACHQWQRRKREEPYIRLPAPPSFPPAITQPVNMNIPTADALPAVAEGHHPWFYFEDRTIVLKVDCSSPSFAISVADVANLADPRCLLQGSPTLSYRTLARVQSHVEPGVVNLQ